MDLSTHLPRRHPEQACKPTQPLQASLAEPLVTVSFFGDKIQSSPPNWTPEALTKQFLLSHGSKSQGTSCETLKSLSMQTQLPPLHVDLPQLRETRHQPVLRGADESP